MKLFLVTWCAVIVCGARAALLTCEDVPTFKNGKFNANKLDIHSVADVICDDGYAPTVSGLLCMLDSNDHANWVGPVGKMLDDYCAQACDELPDIGNGVFEQVSESLLVGSTAQASCDDGYELDDDWDGLITCRSTDDGGREWAGQGECVEIPPLACGAVPVLANGYYAASGYLVGATAQANCNWGYELKNSEGVITCINNSGEAKWEGNNTCQTKQVVNDF